MARSRGYFHCGGALSRIMTSRPVSPSRRVRGGRKDGRVIEHRRDGERPRSAVVPRMGPRIRQHGVNIYKGRDGGKSTVG